MPEDGAPIGTTGETALRELSRSTGSGRITNDKHW
jgi:hypothetical protein